VVGTSLEAALEVTEGVAAGAANQENLFYFSAFA